jgi:hypothetical protein
VGSGIGANLNQNVHNNTFELAASTNAIGVSVEGQQGVTAESNTFLCAAGGCTGARIVNLGNTNQSFSGGVTVDPVGKTFTCGGCSFHLGTGIRVGSVVAMSGFSNAGNNNIFTVTASPSETQFTVSDPANLLVNETCSSGCSYNGVAQANLYNSTLGTGLPVAVSVSAVSGQPTSTTLDYCGAVTPSIIGTGTLNFVTGTCP